MSMRLGAGLAIKKECQVNQGNDEAMIKKTQGLVINYVKYRETSIICKIFTQKFGIQSYIVNGIRSKNAKVRIALFQPLTLLDLVVYQNDRKQIHRISEVKCHYAFQSIPYEIRKTAISLFIAELLGKLLMEEGEQENFFQFIAESLVALDRMKDQFENFHIQFMVMLSEHLGIRPSSADMILSGIGHVRIHDSAFIKDLETVIASNYSDRVSMTQGTRNEILVALIQYYQLHFDSFKEMKSIPVLQEVFQ